MCSFSKSVVGKETHLRTSSSVITIFVTILFIHKLSRTILLDTTLESCK